MKKIKSLVVLLVVLAIAMSMMVACKPAEEDGEIGPSGSNGPTGEVGGTSSDEPGDGTTDGPGVSIPGTNDGGDKNPTGTGDKNPTGTTGDKNPTGTGDKNPSGDGGTTTAMPNPLMNPNKKYNHGPTLSYDLDAIGFSKGKLSDLKGKTLTYFTSVDYGQFSYYNEKGKWTNEWEWFKYIKQAYGVTVKYIRCTPGGVNVVKPFQAMSAGKDCDLIATHVTSFPYVCNILAPLDTYCDFSKFNSNPGLDPMVTALTKWKGEYIVLGPNAVNGVFNYNATFLANNGLEDPYDLWKKGEWNWTNFKKYMTGLPKTTTKGKRVVGCSTWAQYWYWANTNGKPCFELDGDNPNGGVINNWDSAEVKETYLWLEGVMDAAGGDRYIDGSASEYFWDTHKSIYCCMYYATAGMDVVGILEEENKLNTYKWCPFPKNEKNSKAINHVEVYGYGIGLPRKTNKEGNRIAAAKFADLWCNRYTESRFDYLYERCRWTQAQVLEYYQFGQTNGRMGLGSGVGKLANWAGDKTVNFNLSITDASFSTATCMAKLSNYAKQEVANVLKFGVQ